MKRGGEPYTAAPKALRDPHSSHRKGHRHLPKLPGCRTKYVDKEDEVQEPVDLTEGRQSLFPEHATCRGRDRHSGNLRKGGELRTGNVVGFRV